MIPEIINHYTQLYQTHKDNLSGSSSAREKALDYFAVRGLPTTDLEEWKYTPLAVLQKECFPLGFVAHSHLVEIKEKHTLADCCNLFFVNGSFEKTISDELPAGVTCKAACLEESEDFPNTLVALNAALMNAGFTLEIATQLEKPIHLVFITEANASGMLHFRNNIKLNVNAQAEIIEKHVSTTNAPVWHNIVSDIHLDKAAILCHSKIILEDAAAQHIAYTQVYQQADSQFHGAAFSLNGLLSRNEVNVKLQAERAECSLAGLYYANQKNLVEQRITVDHLFPNTTSKECFKGILDNNARGVFDGRIYVEKMANGTNAALSNKNVLLSETAEINTKPQLEIYADDVKCAHGATIGHLDESALFYMQSRGLSTTEARRLLLIAFASDVLSNITFKPLRSQINGLITDLFENSDV